MATTDTIWLKRARGWLMAEYDRLQDIRLALYDAHVFYDVRPRPEKLNLMAELLEDQDPQAIRAAIKQWMLEPCEKGHKPRPPMPNEILARINPEPSIEEQASELAGMLQGMVVKWGNPHGPKAKAELPPLAWDVMKAAYGCWGNFCATSFESNIESRRAQLRDLFAASLRRQKRFASAPIQALPHPPAALGALPQGLPMQHIGAVAKALCAPHPLS